MSSISDNSGGRVRHYVRIRILCTAYTKVTMRLYSQKRTWNSNVAFPQITFQFLQRNFYALVEQTAKVQRVNTEHDASNQCGMSRISESFCRNIIQSVSVIALQSHTISARQATRTVVFMPKMRTVYYKIIRLPFWRDVAYVCIFCLNR